MIEVILLLQLLILVMSFFVLLYFYKTLQNAKEQNMHSVCRFLNDKEVLVRDAECKAYNFNAHVAHHYGKDVDIIVIDLL